MATKSVIEIDVLDDKFQAFAKEFEKIKKALAQMPSDWSKANSSGIKSIQGVGKSLQDAKKKQDDFNKSIKDGEQALKNMAGITANIARNMANTAISFAKFITLGAIGGGFGLGALASATSGQRRTAQGLGITTGQLRSAEVYGGRYINPLQTLGNLADIQSDITKRYLLNPFGLGQTQGKNAAELLPDTLTKGRQLFKQFGGEKSILDATGVTKVIDYETLRRLGNLEEKEFKEFIENLKNGNKQFATFDKLDKAWQDFWVNLNKTSQKLQVTLINVLEKLPESLGKLSDAVADAIETFLSHPELQEWLDSLVQGIKKFAIYLTGGEFKKDVDEFWNTIKFLRLKIEEFSTKLGAIVDQLESFLTRLKNLFGGSRNPELDTPSSKAEQGFFGGIDDAIDRWLRKQYGLSDKASPSSSSVSNFNQALEKAKQDYKAQTGQNLPITSLKRSRKEQQNLYDRWLAGEKGIYMPTNPADYPNQQWFHENAVDIGINQIPKGFNINSFMAQEGFQGIGAKDPVHFNYVNPLTKLENKLSPQNKVQVQINNNAGADINTSANAIQNPRGAN